MPEQPNRHPRKCTGHNKSGELCGNWAIKGGTVCTTHGGSAKQVRAAADRNLAVAEARAMGVPIDLEPNDAILQCIAITAGEVRYCSERIAELEPGDAVGPVITTRPLKEEKGAESATERVEDHGPPALHIWIQARHQAMDRLVTYSKVAIAAGIAERQVRIAEAQAEMLAEAMRRFARAMGHDPAAPEVREALRGSLTVIAGGARA